MRRVQLIHALAGILGKDILEILDARDGWPGLARVRIDSGWLQVAIHIGPIGVSHRGRDDVERRFQNPGKNKPIDIPAGFFPLLLGLWQEGQKPVIVGMDAEARVGRETRQSLFIPVWTLAEASKSGWAEHVNTSNERIFALHPELFPTYVMMRQTGASLLVQDAVLAIEATGMLEETLEPPAERARRITSQLVRSSSFRKKVVASYDERCAMCGFNFGMVEGAHIYPANAPGSFDEVWNGLALCGNHHTAFDRHLIWIDPVSKVIKAHPELIQKAETNSACQSFLSTMFPVVSVPSSSSLAPRSEMFVKRYEYFDSKYDWAI